MDDMSGGDQQQQQPSTSSQPSDNLAMAQQTSGNTESGKVVVVDEFLNTGRTGRRNALGDILDETSAYISTADLPDQLSSLSFSSGDQSTPSTSNTCQPPSSS